MNTTQSFLSDRIISEGKVVLYEVVMWIVLLMLSFLTGRKVVKVKQNVTQWIRRDITSSENAS